MTATSARSGVQAPIASKANKFAGKPKSGEAASVRVPAPSFLSEDSFPLVQYASVLGVHLVLVGFTTLYLPQTTRLFAPLAARKTADRLQSEFMKALTADPSSTLCWIFAGLAVVEVWWASWMRSWSFNQTSKGSADEIKLERARFDGLYFGKLKDATTFTICTALATHVVVVMFGAPLTTHILQTALLSFVMAILTTFTPAFVLGPPSFASDTPSLIKRLTWTRLFAELSPRSTIERAMVYPGVGTFVGGWVGAIPIALDWDRPWQAWPLPPLFGCIGGYIVGTLFALAVSMAKYLATEQFRSQQSKTKTKTN